MRSSFLLALLSLLILPHLQAQPLTIVSTDPVEAATDVPLAKVVVFNLSDPLPAFGSVFATRFTWSPLDSTRLTVFGHDNDENGELTVVFFTLEHTPDTDFSFFVYGLEADNGKTMERPFALNYTTASTIGTNVVSGSAFFRDRVVTAVSSKRARLRRLVRAVLETHHVRLDELLRQGTTTPGVSAKRSGASASLHAIRQNELDLNRTILLLLDSYDLDERTWRIHSATPIQADGTFSFDHVREGTYWPVAINWADAFGDVVGAYGFYDPDGDFEPDPLTVGAGGMAGVEVGLLPIEPSTAAPLAAIARQRAATIADDQRLIEIQARDDASGGLAENWVFVFYSPSRDSLTHVEIDPINIVLDPEPEDEGGPILPTDFTRSQTPIPETMIDSDAAVAIAEANGGAAYRAQFTDPDGVPIELRAGDLEMDVRPDPGEVFWRVTYQPTEAGFDPLILFIDIETGAVLDARPVATEAAPELPQAFTLHQNHPNPFNPSTEITFDVNRPGPLRLTVFDLLGRRIRTLADGVFTPGRHTVRWDGRTDAGSPAPSGVYLYRLEGDGQTAGRLMTLLK